MAKYNYNTIIVNGRIVPCNDILDQAATPLSEFESDSFSFLKEWLGNSLLFRFKTSGSTGSPKTVTFSREQLTKSAEATIHALNLNPSETSLICLSPKYVAGKMMMVRSFINQMKVILSEPSSNPLGKIDQGTEIDFIALVPLQIQTMLENQMHIHLNKIRTIIIGGAPMTEFLRKQILDKLRTNVYATYGMTETITHIALEKIGTMEPGVFHTLPGIKITIDERKCLVIHASFLQEPVMTNDLVEIITPHSFRWIGRWDNVINTGGIKIIPEILEAKLLNIFTRLNIQRRYFIAGLPDPALGIQVDLFIESEPLTSDMEERIRKEMVNNLLKFEIPRQIICIRRFCDTPTGKINRIETLKSL